MYTSTTFDPIASEELLNKDQAEQHKTDDNQNVGFYFKSTIKSQRVGQHQQKIKKR